MDGRVEPGHDNMESMTTAPALADIQSAARTIAGHVLRTPTLYAPRLSALTGAEIFVKYENMQATGSFKDRGALVKLASLSEAERKRGVIAMSAGNHAQAVAYHAARLGIAATIVMPETTPFVKVAATEAYGARIVQFGESIAESATRAEAIASEQNLVFVHPFDDAKIIAGQGTIALEMLADTADLDVVVVPVGGGGLISGIAIAMKAVRPAIEVLAAECALYPSLWNKLHAADRPCGGPTLADGIAVKECGEITFPIIRELVADCLLVEEAHLERAVNAFLTLQATLAEGAGAAGLAAVLARPERFRGRRVGLVVSGGNIDPRVAATIMVRELERADRIVSFRIAIQDRPGTLGTIATLLGRLGANILEVDHRRLFLDVPARGARLDVTIETRDQGHAAAIEQGLRAEGYVVQRLDTGAGGFQPV
jgi:threonine dehydratase